MTTSPDVLTALKLLEDRSRRLGFSLLRVLEEKTHELELRQFLRCLPNEAVKEQQIAEF